MFAFLVWLIGYIQQLWSAPKEDFICLLQGLFQFALTMLLLYVGLRLLWKAIKKALTF